MHMLTDMQEQTKHTGMLHVQSAEYSLHLSVQLHTAIVYACNSALQWSHAVKQNY